MTDIIAVRESNVSMHALVVGSWLLAVGCWQVASSHTGSGQQIKRFLCHKPIAKSQRGFVLTLDALLAVILLLMAVALLGTEWFRPLAPDGLYLKQVSFDTLYMLESTGRLDRAVGGNATAVREIFEILPKSVCMQVAIEDSQGAIIATIARLDCGSYHRELQTAYSMFIYSGEIYKARLESWYRKET